MRRVGIFALALLATAVIATFAAAAAPSTGTAATRVAHKAKQFPAAGRLTVRSVAVRRTPSRHGSTITTLRDFRPDYRPQEIFAVGKKIGANGRVWYRISVPMRPNGTYGWIPARAVKLKPTIARVVVRIQARTIDIYRHGKHVWHSKVAVGAPGMETPRGRFYVTARFVPYRDPFLGVFAVETSAYSRLSEWPGGGVVGIHGTNMPWLLGKAVSHGCVRVSNYTARALRRHVPVGSPILIKN